MIYQPKDTEITLTKSMLLFNLFKDDIFPLSYSIILISFKLNVGDDQKCSNNDCSFCFIKINGSHLLSKVISNKKCSNLIKHLTFID